MYRYQKDQACYEISGTKFGGQPGRSPPVLIGSVFYPRHSIVADRRNGVVDRDRLTEMVSAAETTASDLGLGHALMLYLEHEDAVNSLLEATADLTSGPLFLDSPDPRVKLKALQTAKDIGINQRVVYNSLHVGSSPQEWSSLKENQVDSAVLMAFDPGDLTVKGRIHLLDNGGRLMKRGLLETAEENGIKRPLIDLAATSFDQGAGASLRALAVAKAKWGLPSGLALHNTVETWSQSKGMDDESRKLFRHVDTSSVSIALMAGADWVMYGAIESSKRCLHAAAFTSGVMAQATSDLW